MYILNFDVLERVVIAYPLALIMTETRKYRPLNLRIQLIDVFVGFRKARDDCQKCTISKIKNQLLLQLQVQKTV